MELLEKLQKQLNSLYQLIKCDEFKWPSIVLMGNQNVGKSSLLERLIGMTFLPKENKRITQCPLEISIVNKDGDNIADWIEFTSAKSGNLVVKDFEKIAQHIELETLNRTSISGEPITIKVFTNKLPNGCCLIDLPGLSKFPKVSTSTEKLLNDITLKYILEKNALIIVVVAVNENYLNFDCIEMAKIADPDGNRTLMVLTKLDLTDPRRKELNELLNGQTNCTKLIIGVINYPIKIYGNHTTYEKAKNETVFLQNYYHKIAHKHGINQLNATIYSQIIELVKQWLPSTKENLTKLFINYNKETFSNCGEPTVDLYRTMLEIVSNYCTSYISSILGPHDELVTTELTGGARINFIFNEIFGNTIRNINPLDGFTKASLLTAIRNISGVRPTIFVTDKCFEQLVKAQIRKLEGPSLRCVQLVNDELVKLTGNCGYLVHIQLKRFPILRQRIIATVLELLRSRIQLTNDMIKQLINIHTSYINTNHPDFLTQCRQYKNTNSTINTSQDLVKYNGQTINNNEIIVKQNSSNEYQTIETFIISYFNVVRTAIEDSVPKTIMHFLINYVVENIQSELVAKLIINGKPDINVMKECNEIVQERESTKEIIQNYGKALNILNQMIEMLE